MTCMVCVEDCQCKRVLVRLQGVKVKPAGQVTRLLNLSRKALSATIRCKQS
jgi:hypothetical protein